ncbi:MAG: diguanylate cyclase [Burkholderiales bacterium]|nr:diguanylate cyclase [Burkholderiales bacterium]
MPEPTRPAWPLGLADRLQLGLMLLDGEDRIETVNLWLSQRAQRPAAELVGLTLAEAFPAMQPGRLPAAVQSSRAQGMASMLSSSLNPTSLPLFVDVAAAQRGERLQQLIRVAPLGSKGERKTLIEITDVSAAVAKERALRREQQALAAQRQRLHNVLEATGAGAWEWDLRTGLLDLNERWAEMLGYQLAELGELSVELWRRLVHPDDLGPSEAASLRVIEGEREQFDQEFRMRHKQGQWVWIHSRARVVLRDEAGAALSLAGTHLDVTRRKTAEAERHAAEQRFRHLMGNLPVGVIVRKPDGELIFANQTACAQLGVTTDQVVSAERMDRVLRCRLPDGSLLPSSAFPREEVLRTGAPLRNFLFSVQQGTAQAPIWLNCDAFPIFDVEGRITEVAMGLTDVSALKRSEERVRQLAFIDTLTGLPNRRLLIELLDKAVLRSHRHQQFGALLFLDLNHFKFVNDNYGHAVGDQLLIEAARRLREALRDSDTVARLGGDEFVVSLEELGGTAEEAQAAVQAVADKLRQSLGEDYVFGPIRHRGSVSIGWTLYLGAGRDTDSLLRDADAAMYAAKRAERAVRARIQPA